MAKRPQSEIDERGTETMNGMRFYNSKGEVFRVGLRELKKPLAPDQCLQKMRKGTLEFKPNA